MPLLAPAVLVALFVGVTGGGDGSWLPADAVVFYVAACAGWYTHLMLDGLFRIFPEDLD